MRAFVGVVALCAFANQVVAQEEWIGRKVFLKEGAEVRLPDEKIPWRKIGVPATVTAVRNDWLWIGRGWVKKAQVISDGREALDYMTKRLEQDPSAFWYIMRGLVWDELCELDNAVADYGDAIQLNPKSARAFSNRGTAWSSKGELEKAIADHTEAIRLDPKDGIA